MLVIIQLTSGAPPDHVKGCYLHTSVVMVVHTMSIPEAIAEAKTDLPSVQNKIRSLIHEQERLHRKDRRGGDRIAQGTYTSLRRNNWLYNIHVTKKHSSHNVLMWFYNGDGLHGLQLAHEGYHFMFTPHFFTRYRERSGCGAVEAVPNLTAYFFRNPAVTAMSTGREHLGLPAFIGMVPDGYVLGTLHQEEGYHRFRTFVHHDQAFAQQEEHWQGLAAIRELQLRHPAVMAQLQPRYKRPGHG